MPTCWCWPWGAIRARVLQPLPVVETRVAISGGWWRQVWFHQRWSGHAGNYKRWRRAHRYEQWQFHEFLISTQLPIRAKEVRFDSMCVPTSFCFPTWFDNIYDFADWFLFHLFNFWKYLPRKSCFRHRLSHWLVPFTDMMSISLMLSPQPRERKSWRQRESPFWAPTRRHHHHRGRGWDRWGRLGSITRTTYWTFATQL